MTLVAGTALTGVFIGWELRAAHPMMPLRLFRSRAYSAGNVACLCVFGVLFGMVFFMAQFLQTGLGYGPLSAGLRLAPGWATLMVIAPFAGTLIRRFGERMLIAGGLMVFAGALIWIALIARTGLPYADMVAPLILAGSGVSLAIPPTQSVVMTAVAPADIGKASGTFNMLRQLGGVFGVAICAAVFAAYGSYASPATFTSGFGPAMGACAGLALAGAVAGLVIPSRGPVPLRHPAPRGTARHRSLTRRGEGLTPGGWLWQRAAYRRLVATTIRPCRLMSQPHRAGAYGHPGRLLAFAGSAAEEGADHLGDEGMVVGLGQAGYGDRADHAHVLDADRKGAAVRREQPRLDAQCLVQRPPARRQPPAHEVGGRGEPVDHVDLALDPRVVLGRGARQGDVEQLLAVAPDVDRDRQFPLGRGRYHRAAEPPCVRVVEPGEYQPSLLRLERGD